MTGNRRPWWGKYHLDVGEVACWEIGAVALWIGREPRAWRIASKKTERGGQDDIQVRVPCGNPMPDKPDQCCVYALSHPSGNFRLEPRLADKPLVWRPESPLFIAPGDEFTFLLRSPLWIAFHVESAEPLLYEVPTRRLSETWFGSPLEKGGMAYAADRQAMLPAEALSADGPHATTPLCIRNASTTLLPLERIHLPVPYLSLYTGERGIWTQRVVIELNGKNEEPALLQLEKGPPEEAGAAEPLSGPREHAEKNLVFQAFSRIFR